MKKILIVDDSPAYRRLLVTVMQKWGYETYEAEDGLTALALLEHVDLNLVISDWEMPNMDGLHLCEEIRRRDNGHYVYLILLTVHGSAEDLKMGFAAGADDFLRKPVDQGELQARLHAGERILSLESSLAARNTHLHSALQQIENDLRTAARLQQSILPDKRVNSGRLRVDWLFIPSGIVSGDVFNVFPLNDHYLGFYCLDIAGHGVGAAMMSMVLARQFARGKYDEDFLLKNKVVTDPADVMLILNQRFCDNTTEVLSYFTMVYGVVDVVSGEGSLCQAGHPSPFLVQADGTVCCLGKGGFPIGLMTTFSWESTAFTLQPGDRLCIYSDGMIECENAHHEQFGQQRLEHSLLRHRESPLADVMNELGCEINRWGQENREIQDDISLLVIEREN